MAANTELRLKPNSSWASRTAIFFNFSLCAFCSNVAFELVELCNPKLAKDIADQRKRGAKPGFHWVDDPSEEAFRGKLEKSYRTDFPIELLCYTGRTGVPDDMSLATLRELATTHGLGPFRRVWFLGEKSCELAAELC